MKIQLWMNYPFKVSLKCEVATKHCTQELCNFIALTTRLEKMYNNLNCKNNFLRITTRSFISVWKSILPPACYRKELSVLSVRLCVFAAPGVSRLLGPSRNSQQEMAAGAAVWARAADPPGGNHWATSQAAQQPGASVERSTHACLLHTQCHHRQQGWVWPTGWLTVC